MPGLKLILGVLVCLPILSNAEAQNYGFEGGNWFDGERFVTQTVYSVDGFLAFSKPERVDKSFDLEGGFVIPPFGEAHNHDLSSEYGIEKQINKYLWDGVFYVKLQSAFSISMAEILSKVNKPDSVDAVFAYAPVTGPGGHPIRIREIYFERGYYDDKFSSKEEIAGIGYTMVRDEAELDRKWPLLLAQKPDFIKFMLSHSEEYEFRKDDKEFFGHKGLDPKLAPLLVNKAHAAGLRISAHIESGPDFHYAVAAGVDEIAHLPGSRQPEIIREADARLTAEQGVTVITTLMLSTNIAKSYPAWFEKVMTQHRSNLKRLNDAGVRIAIGSDFTFRDTSLGEALLLHDLDIFSNMELLKMWSENSPQTIFPERKIGHLKEGYEASFLVLDNNPLDDFTQVKDIKRRFKQGHWLHITKPVEEQVASP